MDKQIVFIYLFYPHQHYKMNIMDKCDDPNNYDQFGYNVTYPTNPYFPPGMNWPHLAISNKFIMLHSFKILGSICAKTTYYNVCFFAGESGSPLMIKYALFVKLLLFQFNKYS